MKHWLPALLLLLPLPAYAFPAIVVRVADGDTVTVVHGGAAQRVRVFGIDAPESDQPGGLQAQRDMAALVLGQTVEVTPPPGKRKFPRSYDRIVAVLTTPAGTDAGLVMLTLGDAWAYDWFTPPRSYDEAMTQAAGLHLGLWRDPAPEAPWMWRRAHRTDHWH